MLKSLFRKTRKKVVVLGLDGVPCSLARRFASEGVMPNLAKRLEQGTLCSMTASIPEVSSTSWSTFMTGVNPGRHGIYGFTEIRRDDYSWKFPNFMDLRSKTIWERSGERNKRSVVLNIPSTYPARPLNGMLVSGFVALDLKHASYPEKLYEYLKGIGYRLDVDAAKAVTSVDEFTHDITRTFRKRVEAFHYLYDHEEWDLFIAAITETDRLHHYLWSALDDEGHPQHRFFIDFYRELDEFIGRFSAKIDPDTPFIVLSDHGFTSIQKEIYLNTFLREKGYLKFARPEPQSFADMESSSTAFVLDPSRVYVHARDRYRDGSVEGADCALVRDALRRDLLSLECEGEKVIRDVFLKEQIYTGECLPHGPDLVVLPHEGYDLKGSINKAALFGNGPLTGGHTHDNALFYINREIRCESPNIVDVGSTVLHHLDIDSSGLDGKVLG